MKYRISFHFIQVLMVSVLIFLTGCHSRLQVSDVHDPSLNLRRKDYETLTPPVLEKKVSPPISLRHKPVPAVISVPLPIIFQTPVSLRINHEVPLEEAILELALQAKVNVVIKPGIQGSSIIHANKQPFLEVIKQLCNMNHLRYQVEGTVLRIEPDEPYLKTYNVQSLSLIRKNQNKISIATDIFTGAVSNKNQVDNGSNTLLTGTNTNDFWQELEDNLKTILKNSHPFEAGTSAPIDYSVHKQGGLVSIFATFRQHELIESYLSKLKKSISAQVLIEAKIVEVNLNSQFQTGINWQLVRGALNVTGPLGAIAKPGLFNSQATPERDVISFAARGKNLSMVASFVEKFGTVRTLSNPRLTVMNNQSAVLKVATNQVFFRVLYDREVGSNLKPDVERASSQIQTVPIGLVMVVHPSINLETGEITMTLRPTVSRVTGTKQDPAVSLMSKQQTVSEVPEVQVREMDSVLRMRSGDICILGGLMEERADNQESGFPGASDVWLFNWLLSGKSDQRQVTELVIFLCATILEDEAYEGITPADANLYENFTRDPRPLVF